jgi:hypothetical protein
LFENLTSWKLLKDGGHFLAHEAPQTVRRVRVDLSEDRLSVSQLADDMIEHFSKYGI